MSMTGSLNNIAEVLINDLGRVAIALFSALVWFLIQYSCPAISSTISSEYRTFPAKLKKNWDSRVVALVHAIVICFFAGYSLYYHYDTLNSNRNYTENPVPISVLTFCIATGYFFWDLIFCLRYYAEFGIGFLLHGIACFAIYASLTIGYLNYWGCFFLLYELSTPFLNFAWLMDKAKCPFPIIKTFFGLLLIITFFLIRIIGGTIGAYYVLIDLWVPAQTEVILPFVARIGYTGLNFLLTILNFYWFAQILKMVFKSDTRSNSSNKTKKIH